MNVLYCGDSAMAPGLILSVMSLSRQVSEPLQIYVLTMELDTPNKHYTPLSHEIICSLRRYLQEKDPASSICRLDVTSLFLRQIPTANLRTRFTPYCMLRLLADQVAQIPDRVLYLDTDVLCRQDFSAFYHQNLSDWELAGVLDDYGSWLFHRQPFCRDYVNSGVLLLNMEKIRRTGLFEECRKLCQKRRFFLPDQSVINLLAQGKKIVPRKYNEQRRLREDTVFQHFTTGFRFFPCLHTETVKPWQFDLVHSRLKLHEYDDLFAEYQSLYPSHISSIC